MVAVSNRRASFSFRARHVEAGQDLLFSLQFEVDAPDALPRKDAYQRHQMVSFFRDGQECLASHVNLLANWQAETKNCILKFIRSLIKISINHFPWIYDLKKWQWRKNKWKCIAELGRTDTRPGTYLEPSPQEEQRDKGHPIATACLKYRFSHFGNPLH